MHSKKLKFRIYLFNQLTNQPCTMTLDLTELTLDELNSIQNEHRNRLTQFAEEQRSVSNRFNDIRKTIKNAKHVMNEIKRRYDIEESIPMDVYEELKFVEEFEYEFIDKNMLDALKRNIPKIISMLEIKPIHDILPYVQRLITERERLLDESMTQPTTSMFNKINICYLLVFITLLMLWLLMFLKLRF